MTSSEQVLDAVLNPVFTKRLMSAASGRERQTNRAIGSTFASRMWVVRVGGDDRELRPWHYIYVYSDENWIHIYLSYPHRTCADILSKLWTEV